MGSSISVEPGAEGEPIKAIVYHEYGPPGVLELAEVADPVAKDDEVLVQVFAAAVNPGDWFLLSGTPYVLRTASGFRRPKHSILGLAIAGRIKAVGTKVSRFRCGDDVYAGINHGGFAQYATAPEDGVALKPSNLSFPQAAAVPVAGVTALQGLRDTAQLRPGQTVLITGASGGVGSFAVQIAKAFGAEVTGVCSTANLEMVRSIGADYVIDYTKDDFTRGQQHDLVLDNVGDRSLSDLRRALTPNGMLIPNANSSGLWVGNYVTRAVRALALSPFVSQKLRPFAATESGRDLAKLGDLIESGKVAPVIERTYPLTATGEALGYYGLRHTRGKVVITVGHAGRTEDGDG